MTRLTFNQMTKQQLEELFGLQRVREHPILHEWLSTPQTLSDVEQAVLADLKDILLDRIEDWNEQELIIKCIAPMLALINFDTEHFSAFAERSLSADIEEHQLSGVVDVMIASGRQTPRAPFFCLHEYKKEAGTDSDPGGQALAAMLSAQILNHEQFPIYGAYVLGRNWFFMVLERKTYSISNEYAASKDDIFEIAHILKSLKQRIQQQISG